MRNQKRIKTITKLLEEYWTKNPDLRLCQLISNLHGNGRQDIFHTQDEEVQEVLEKRLKAEK